MKKVADIAREKNIKFNLKKFQHSQREIKYIGHIFSKDGIKSDPERIKAIVQMESPKNKRDLQRFLGMLNYVRNFVPNMSEKTAKLRELRKNNVDWIWLRDHENAMNELRTTLTSAPVLKIFDNTSECTIQCDASKDGLGYCLLQNGKPVAYGSKSLTDAQKNYGQIEKEFLAILAACHKFHHYIYGRNMIVQTDHKPLVAIIDKNLHEINSVRLQRIRIKLLKYRLKLVYVPGKEMHVADTLSRAFLNERTEYPSLNQVVHSVAVSEPRRKEIVEATNAFKFGWPANKTKVNSNIQVYWKIRNQIYEENALMFYDHKIIMPLKLRHKMIQEIHEAAHFGINRTLSRAKEIMYWPGMNKQIIDIVSKCAICAKYQRSNTKEPMLPLEVPSAPFEKIGCDFCEYNGKNYLIVKDYFSKWLEIIETKTKTAAEVVTQWRILFATFGIPGIIVADNQPFASYYCHQYVDNCKIKIVTSSPYYPKSNGMAERAVQTAKAILKKSFEAKSNYQTALMEYRNTQLPGIYLSPAQIIFGRQVRTSTLTPIHTTQNQYSERVKELLTSAQQKAKLIYDQHAKARPESMRQDKVLVQSRNKTWEPAQIVNASPQPRSYIVRKQKGNLQRRNKIHLRSAHDFSFKPKTIASNDSDDETPEEENVDTGEGENRSNQHNDTTAQMNSEVPTEPTPPAPRATGNRQTARRARPFNSNRFVTITRRGRIVRTPDYYGRNHQTN